MAFGRWSMAARFKRCRRSRLRSLEAAVGGEGGLQGMHRGITLGQYQEPSGLRLSTGAERAETEYLTD